MASSRQASPDSSIQAFAARFRQQDYVHVPGVLGNNAALLYAQSALMQKPDYWMPEPAYKARGRYADALGEAILSQFQPLVATLTGRELYPCYSFLRIYEPGSELPRHTDRPSCEFSVTLHVGKGPETDQWPIWVKSQGQSAAVNMAPGDLMVYRGSVLPHWRKPFKGDFWIQLFLHYVDAKGPYAHYRHDGRQALGAFQIGKDKRELPDPTKIQAHEGCWCGSGLAFAQCHQPAAR